jgi:uncharacterized protein YceH (UPF0502 family)
MDIVLTPLELRVMGCLMEKEMATPDYYPMTLNALVAACNQKSNRDPVMKVDDKTLAKTLDDLRYDKKLVLHIDSAGSRVLKYQHNIQSRFEFDRPEQALLCELFLRGPQTPGELRSRTRRLHPFESLGEVDRMLQELADREGGPFVVRLPREPGRKEQRWAHCFGGEVEAAPREPSPAPEPEQATPKPPAENEQIAKLEQEVAALRRELDQLKQAFETFKQQFE